MDESDYFAYDWITQEIEREKKNTGGCLIVSKILRNAEPSFCFQKHLLMSLNQKLHILETYVCVSKYSARVMVQSTNIFFRESRNLAAVYFTNSTKKKKNMGKPPQKSVSKKYFAKMEFDENEYFTSSSFMLPFSSFETIWRLNLIKILVESVHRKKDSYELQMWLRCSVSENFGNMMKLLTMHGNQTS